MKTVFIAIGIIFFAPCILWAQSWMPTNGGAEEKDVFKLKISSNGNTEYIYLVIDTRNTAEYENADGLQIQTTWMLASIAYDRQSQTNQVLAEDRRGKDEYIKNYSVEFPLWMKGAKDNTTQYTLHLDILGGINKSVTFVQLIDASHPNLFINLLDGDYVFTSDSGESETSRFIVKCYAGSVWKAGTDGNWNDPNNWYGGDIPGIGGSVKNNNAAYIPAGVNVTVPSGYNLSLGALLNHGSITIENGASLTLQGDVKLY
ncbi:MAG: hypothetical protein LBG77_05815 [Dysgonamonadaceae bacterium]|jgi:hypothetical protein|nr:hypothetical protein [Dysgonamonadaceae bacterium]